MNRETELKFVGPADALVRLRNSPELKRLAGNRRAQTTIQAGVYFDTKEYALRQAGLVLRVRNEGQGFVQTLKSVQRDDLATRMEFKSEVPSSAPDVNAIPESRLRWRVERILDGRLLVPLFEVEVQRTRMLLSPKRGTEIEAAIDTGLIKHMSGNLQLTTPICEFELELLKGNAGELVECARALTLGLPLTLSLQSKSDKGYALAQGKLDAPVQAARVELPDDAAADDVLCAVIGNCLHHLLGNWAAVLNAQDSEGIHQMRVALRRLRVALSMFREPFRGVLSGVEDQTRAIATALGCVRDLDVFDIEMLRPLIDAYGDDDRLQAFSAAVNSRRRAARQRGIDTLEGENFRKLVLDLVEITYSRPWLRLPVENNPAVQSAVEFACERLQHRFAQALKLGQKFEELDSEQRHELRIKLKQLRYATDFTRSLFSKRRVRRFSKRLGVLQDVLGQVNDAAVAGGLVHEILAERREGEDPAALVYAGGLIAGWYGAHSRHRMKKLRKSWRKFAKLKPFWRRRLKRLKGDADAPKG